MNKIDTTVDISETTQEKLKNKATLLHLLKTHCVRQYILGHLDPNMIENDNFICNYPLILLVPPLHRCWRLILYLRFLNYSLTLEQYTVFCICIHIV